MLRVQVLLLQFWGFAPTALQACPSGFVAARSRRQASETVDGWATPIVSVHRSSAPGVRMVSLLLAVAVLVAGEPLVGEAGLVELAAARAAVRIVAGEGLKTVQRIGDPDGPSEPKRVRFAVAVDGRYDVVETDPADPDGLRVRLGSDGTMAWEVSVAAIGEAPVQKKRPASNDFLARMFACLRLDLTQLRRDYAVELVAVADGRELRLVPSDPAVAREIVRIVLILDVTGRPVRVVLDESSDNRYRLEITSFSDDPLLDPAWFRPPGP